MARCLVALPERLFGVRCFGGDHQCGAGTCLLPTGAVARTGRANRFSSPDVERDMKTKITGSLVVCVAAAAFTAGALVLNDDSPDPTPAAAAAAPPKGAIRPVRRPGLRAGSRDHRRCTGWLDPAPVALQIRDFTFSPATARPGGSIVVQNRDGVAHTVTADGGTFDSGRVNPQGTATITAPKAAGSYRFTCVIHPQMSGTLVVR